jgi:RNA polymerase sigma-70 factor (ECF subfamily)
MARGWIVERVGAKAKDAFPFMGERCDRVVLDVLARLAELSGGPSQIQ